MHGHGLTEGGQNEPLGDIGICYLRYLVQIDYLQASHVVLNEFEQIGALRAPVSHGYARGCLHALASKSSSPEKKAVAYTADRQSA